MPPETATRNASIGCWRPFTEMTPRDSSLAVSPNIRAVSGPMTISPGPAMAWRRAATFVVSPMAVKFRYSSLPILPTSAGPELSPI
jgi:hypothetical protein